MTADALTFAAFSPRLRDTFRLNAPGGGLDLVLAEVEDLGKGVNRNAFSLVFTAPLQPVIPQAIYRLDNAALGPVEIFLVPLGPQDGVFRYQAVFT